MLNRIKITIMDSAYTVASVEDEEYVGKLAADIDHSVKQLLDSNNRLSLNSALVLCSLSYADSLKKSELSADHIRTQLTGYIEDCAKARQELEIAKREIAQLRK